MEKRFSSLLVAASVVATTFSGPVLAAAQDVGPFGNRPAEIDLTETYQPPRVYVESIDNTEQKGQTLKGTLHLFNAEETTISDLAYRVEIYDAASVQTNAQVLYAYVAGDRIGPMITKEERAVDFKLSIPNLPAGDYALRFQLMHSNGRKLGWGDYTWTSHLSSDRVDALATGITLPEFNNTVVEPLTGPNVDPSSTFSLEATVVNPLDHEVTVKPILRVYPFDVSRGEPDMITFDALTLAAHEQHTLSLQITATEHAGVSIGHLTFEQDGVSLSPIAAYRWVVRGQSADIVATKIQSVGTKAGDTTDIQLDYVGPADAETHLTGSLLVTVNDVEGTVGGVQVEGIALTDALNSSLVRVPMNRGFESVPVVNVTILDANGLTLAHSTAEIPASSANVTFSLSGSVMRVAGDVIPYALLFLALALLALAARSIVRSTELRKLTAKAMAFCLLMMQVGSFSSFAYAQAGMIDPVDLSLTGNGSVPVAEMVAPQAQGAQGIVVIRADSSTKWFSNFGTKPIVELFVNRPIHDAPVGTYQCDGTIPFEYRVSYVVCYNVPSVVRVIGRVDANGGKHSNIVGNQQSDWKEVYDEQIRRNNASDLRCTTGFDGQWCFREDGDSTSINLRSLHITAQNTTFQVAAKRSYDAARYVPTDIISATEPDLLGGSSTLVNIWLNCRDAAVCGNGNVEQGEECDDGNNSSNDACTNQCKNAFCGDGIVRTGSEQCDDGNQNNNDGCTNQCTLPVQNTDVTIAKTADQTVVTKGGAATFRIQGQNISQTTAQNVVITDSIPSQLTIVSAPGCTITGQNLRCTAGTLSPGQTTSTFVVNTTVRNDASITNGMIIVNSAHIATDTPESNYGNNDDTAQITVQVIQTTPKSDMLIQKSGPTQVNRGETLNYSLIAKNNGPDTAQNVVVTDVIPAGLTYIDNQSDSRCNQSGNNVVCQLGSMNNQQQTSIALVFETSNSTSCGTVTNTASVSTTTQDDFVGNNQSSFQTQVVCQNPNADVQIQKSGPTQIDQGDRMIYTIIAKNNGPATANNVVVTDAIPAGLTYVTGGSDSRCNQNGNNIVCQLGTMSNQQQISLTLGFQSSASTSCGNLTNTASIATSSQDTNLNNNQSSFTTQVQCQNTPPQCSDGIDNDGDGKIDMQDPDCSNPNDNDESNPNDCVIVHASVHSLGANRSYAELPSLSQLPAHTVIRNIDLFNHVLDASDLSNADIVVYGDRNKDSGPWRDLTNSELSLFANAFNSGVDFTFAADNPTQDEASPGTRQILNTIQSAMRYLDTYVGEQHGTHTPNTTLYPFLAGKIFDFSTDGLKSPGDLTASGNAQCVFSLNGRCHAAWMPASGNKGFIFAEGNAGVGSSQYLKNFINMACPTTPQADLQIVKSGPTQIDRGSTVNYSVIVKNNGPDVAQNVVVTDVIPTGLTYVDNQSDSRCNQNGNSVVCQLNSMNNQQQTSIALVFQSSSTMSCGTMTNTASVTTTTQDTGNSNNQSSFQTLVNCPVQTTDISLSKTANMTTVQRGDSVTYTLTVTNISQNAAQNVSIAEPVTSYLESPVVVSGPCTVSNGNVNCTIGTLNAGQSASVQIRYTVNQNAPVGQNIVNVATASTTTQDTNMGNNQASATVTVAGPGVGCVQVTKEAFDPFGQRISVVPQFQFTLDGGQTIVNNSNGSATFNNIAVGTHTVTEVIPNGWTQSNVTPANGTVTVTAGASCAQVTFRNQQNSVSSSSSSSSQNNTGCVDVLKEAFDIFGQKITVTPQFQFQLDGGQTMTNNTDGRVTFNNVPAGTHTVTEVIPSGWNQFLVTPLNGTVNVVAGNSCAGVVFKNQQTSSSSSSSSSSGAPDMTISKSGPSTAQQNGQISYTIQVTNSGNATAQNVTVTDSLPSGTTYQSATGNNLSCSLNGSTVNCQLGSMNAGESRTITLNVTVNGSVACNAVLFNTASVNQVSGETNTSNNTSTQVQTTVQCNNTQTGCIDITKTAYDSNGNQIYSVPSFLYTMDGSRTVNNDSNGRARFDNVPVGTHTVIETVNSGWNLESVSPNNGAVNVVAGSSCAQVQFRNRQTTNSNYDFTITKTDGESEVDQGDELTYTIRVRNNSSQTVNNVTVTDTLPDEVDFNSCTKSCSHSGRFITWSDQTFGAYEEREYEVDVDVDDNADGTITNEARVQVGSFSRTATDRTDINDNNDQDVEADLTKVANVSEVFPGGIVEYTLTLRNTGDADLKDVTVEDILPAEMIIVDDDDADERNGSRLTWDIGDLDSGDTWTATYRTTVSTSAFPGQILSNRACADDEDNNLDQCETVTVAVIGNLPQTGIFGGLTASSIKLRPIKLGGSSPLSSAGSAGAPLAAWVSIVGLGMGLGAGVGRKFLIGF